MGCAPEEHRGGHTEGGGGGWACVGVTTYLHGEGHRGDRRRHGGEPADDRVRALAPPAHAQPESSGRDQRGGHNETQVEQGDQQVRGRVVPVGSVGGRAGEQAGQGRQPADQDERGDPD